MHRGHREVHHATLVVLQLHGHVVEQGDIHTDEGRELLVDAHGRDVEHRRGHGAARGDVGDEAEAVHILHIGAVGIERTYRVDALVGVVDVDALEVLLEHLQLAQAAVGDAPVGQHRQHRGEEAQTGPLRIAAGIGGEEGRYHHVGRVAAHATVGGVEGHTGIHKLDVAGIGFHPRGVEVDLEVAGRLHGGLELQLLGGVRGGGVGHAIVVEQPAVVVGAVQVPLLYRLNCHVTLSLPPVMQARSKTFVSYSSLDIWQIGKEYLPVVCYSA